MAITGHQLHKERQQGFQASGRSVVAGGSGLHPIKPKQPPTSSQDVEGTEETIQRPVCGDPPREKVEWLPKAAGRKEALHCGTVPGRGGNGPGRATGGFQESRAPCGLGGGEPCLRTEALPLPRLPCGAVTSSYPAASAAPPCWISELPSGTLNFSPAR